MKRFVLLPIGYSKKKKKTWIPIFFLSLSMFCVALFLYLRKDGKIEDFDKSEDSRVIRRHASAGAVAVFENEKGTVEGKADAENVKSASDDEKAKTENIQISTGNTPNAISEPDTLAQLDAPDINYEYFISESEPVFRQDEESLRTKALSEAKSYVIVAGDSLGKIAKNSGCSVEELKIANGMQDDRIMVGQKIFLPKCGPGIVVKALVSPKNDTKEIIPVAASWRKNGVNTDALPKLMRERGFTPPRHFMALIVEITFDPTRKYIVKERAFDYNGTSSKREGWNPASTVKLFAAIAALDRLESLGFTSDATATFNGKHKYSVKVSELIRLAIIQSDNIAFNRVAQLASYDHMHNNVLRKFGITTTNINRAYEQKAWTALGEDVSLRISPSITLTEGRKKQTLPATHGKALAICSSAACTTLGDLAESTRRLMLQEQLPENQSFNLKQHDLIMLRRAMRSERTRGTEMVDNFAQVFNDSRVRFYSKPGFAGDWFTDNVYIFDPRHNQAWIVTMAGYPGRDSLNNASKIVAKIINQGKLRAIP